MAKQKLDPKVARDLAELTGEDTKAPELSSVLDQFGDEGVALMKRAEAIALRIESYKAELDAVKSQLLPVLKRTGYKSVRGFSGTLIGWRVNSPKRTFDQKWAIATLLQKGVTKRTIESHYTMSGQASETIAITISKELKASLSSDGE